MAEFYALLLGLLTVALVGFYAALDQQPSLALPLGAGLGALLLAAIGGTPLAFFLYFCTTFGGAIMIPGLPTSLNRIVAVLLFLAIALEFPRLRQRLHLSWPLFWFLAFNAYVLTISYLFQPPEAEYPVETFFYIVVFFLIVLRYWQDRWLRWLVGAIALSGLLTVVLPGLFEILVGRNILASGSLGGRVRRVDGLTVNAIVYAFVGCFALPFTVTTALEARNNIARLLWWGTALLLLFVVNMTFNRQTPIILAAMAFVYLLLIRHPKKNWIWAAAIAGALVATPLIGMKLADRFSTARSILLDTSLSVRHDKALIAIEMWKANPVFGVGHTYFGYHWNDYIPPGRLVLLQVVYPKRYFVDMGYLTILCEFGLIGSGIVLALFLSSALYLWRHYRMSLQLQTSFHTNVLAAVASCYALLLVSLLIQDTMITVRTYVMVGVMVAVGIAIEDRLGEQHDAKGLTE